MRNWEAGLHWLVLAKPGGVGMWAYFQLGTESVSFFPRAISPAWPEVGPGAKTQQGKQKSPVTN